MLGHGASVDLLIDDLDADLEGRSFEVARVAGGWMLGTRPAYAAAIRAAADVSDQDLDLREYDVAVLTAIACHQPITRDGLKDIWQRDQPRSDRQITCARADRHRPKIPATWGALHLCHDREASDRVRHGDSAGSAGPGAA